MPATEAIALPANYHPEKPLEEMGAREVVAWLRHMPNPQTNKPQHSLTEISIIAGSSKGWPDFVLRRSIKKGSDNSQFHKNLVKYGNRLLKDLIPMAQESDRPGRSSTFDVSRPAVTLSRPTPEAPMPAISEAPKGDVRTSPNTVIAGNGMRIVTETPKPKPEAKPVTPPAPALAVMSAAEAAPAKAFNFMEEFEEIKARLWAETEALDDLEKQTPPIFRAGIAKLRDDLMGVLQQMDG